MCAITRPWSSVLIGACRPLPKGNSIRLFAQISFAKGGETSQSAKKVGRRCVVGTPDQSKTRSDTQWSRAALLFELRRAEICDMLTIAATPASFAAWAKKALAWTMPGLIG